MKRAIDRGVSAAAAVYLAIGATCYAAQGNSATGQAGWVEGQAGEEGRTLATRIQHCPPCSWAGQSPRGPSLPLHLPPQILDGFKNDPSERPAAGDGPSLFHHCQLSPPPPSRWLPLPQGPACLHQPDALPCTLRRRPHVAGAGVPVRGGPPDTDGVAGEMLPGAKQARVHVPRSTPRRCPAPVSPSPLPALPRAPHHLTTTDLGSACLRYHRVAGQAPEDSAPPGSGRRQPLCTRWLQKG